MANYKRVFIDGYSYFITVVTHQRNPILIDNIDLLRKAFAHSKIQYSYEINAIVILPEHFHMIITPQNAKEYPKILSAIKRYFSRHCPKQCYHHLSQSISREKRGLKPIWQKRFYEHSIRDSKDMNEKMQYIYHNPCKHQYTNDPKKWKYSSFYQNP